MKQKQSSGTCAFQRTTPPTQTLLAVTRKINVIIPFNEALRLQFAINERLHAINKFPLNTRQGKRQAVNLAIDFKNNDISVMPGHLSLSD